MKFKFCGTQGSHSPLPITPYTLQYLHYPLTLPSRPSSLCIHPSFLMPPKRNNFFVLVNWSIVTVHTMSFSLKTVHARFFLKIFQDFLENFLKYCVENFTKICYIIFLKFVQIYCFRILKNSVLQPPWAVPFFKAQ